MMRIEEARGVERKKGPCAMVAEGPWGGGGP